MAAQNFPPVINLGIVPGSAGILACCEKGRAAFLIPMAAHQRLKKRKLRGFFFSRQGCLRSQAASPNYLKPVRNSRPVFSMVLAPAARPVYSFGRRRFPSSGGATSDTCRSAGAWAQSPRGFYKHLAPPEPDANLLNYAHPSII